MNETTLVFGGRGLVGSAIKQAAIATGGTVVAPTSCEVDLRDRRAVTDYIAAIAPRRLYLAAAVVGGILENSRNPVPFVNDNVLIQTHVMEAAFSACVPQVMLLGSSCIYPRECRQPMRECDLMTGPLEPTNSAYAMAKLVGLEQCLAYNRQFGTTWVYVVPPNVYGPRDHFFTAKSHVISALMTRLHEAVRMKVPSVTVWGTGKARREFIYSEDLAAMLVRIMEEYKDPRPLNVGSGTDVSIRELATTIAEVVGYQGEILWDESKPDGMPQKLMDSSRMHRLGVRATTSLREGLEATYSWFTTHVDELRRQADARSLNV